MSDLVSVSEALCDAVDPLTFSAPVTHVYNPLRYAWRPHHAYLQRFGSGPKEAVFLGMNPGPWGMAQTGVPFGEIAAVRDWMDIEEPVDKPPIEHAKRPVEGFACTRSEVSGARMWGWAAERFDGAAAFFDRFFVLNYCPLMFMEESGRNRTPDKVPVAETKALFAACDKALVEMVQILKPQMVIGVGAWAEKKAQQVLSDVPTARILHPSPASRIANRGWAPQADAQLVKLGVLEPKPE